MTPVRLQLSRRKGFDLQAVSRAANGLPAKIVARPTAWGNPFHWQIITHEQGIGRQAAQAVAVDRYAAWLRGEGVAPDGVAPPEIPAIRGELAGRNLACWCAPGTPCHADILLRIANG